VPQLSACFQGGGSALFPTGRGNQRLRFAAFHAGQQIAFGQLPELQFGKIV
jgi:hypothetical protein